jgi:hypothetical protein
MRKNRGYILIIIIFILLFLLLYCYYSHRGRKEPQTAKHWISWNILFTPSSLSSSASVEQAFETYLNNYVHSYDPSAVLTFQYIYCPCDSLLTNIDATLVYGSGNPVPPPPTQPNPGPSGDYILANNIAMEIPLHKDDSTGVPGTPIIDTTYFTTTPSSKLRKTLAVIDTGLDTLKFKQTFPNTVWKGDLLWQEATGNSTLFNVVLGEPNILMDQGPVFHGTAATAITLKTIQSSRPDRVPHIMSIRAFDEDERGSIYTASCAMSYAIKNQADYINASWGYYGHEDLILKNYLLKADSHSIRIIAAAGNTPGPHERPNICRTDQNDQNDLDRLVTHDSLFYPACFAPIIPNLVSVTQLRRPSPPFSIRPCYYQNFSPNYITVGVMDKSARLCCTFDISFLQYAIEGSSFATPAMSGILISGMDPGDMVIKQYINVRAEHTPAPFVTSNGNYFKF